MVSLNKCGGKDLIRTERHELRSAEVVVACNNHSGARLRGAGRRAGFGKGKAKAQPRKWHAGQKLSKAV